MLEHFHDDAVFTSPVAQRIGFAEDGVVRGKQDLRRYWLAALAQNPGLHFRVTGVYWGVNAMVITFINQDNVDRAEVLAFEEGWVVEGQGTFGVE